MQHADVETSDGSGDEDDSENDQRRFANTHGEVEPGTDNQENEESRVS